MKTFAFFPADESWKDNSGIDWSKTDSDFKGVLQEFVEKVIPDWNGNVKDLIRECDEGETAIRPLYSYPPGHRFEKKVSG
jgi:hypothetical protein